MRSHDVYADDAKMVIPPVSKNQKDVISESFVKTQQIQRQVEGRLREHHHETQDSAVLMP